MPHLNISVSRQKKVYDIYDYNYTVSECRLNMNKSNRLCFTDAETTYYITLFNSACPDIKPDLSCRVLNVV